ncbi:MAG: phosphoglucomutase/phosphomannomutase family protein, partial [Elusimicrobiota bacterium]|nr:phosphoglucomutase/phosphomannomutase family protein [Elusimicrobiota bacterium]
MTTSEKKIKFGTDGWRGIIADDFTYANLSKLAVRIAEYISSRGNSVSVGYDNRFISPEYAEFFAAVLEKKGVKVDLSDQPVPTPAVSRRVKETKSSLGVMITASHNSAVYNGIKIKENYGGSARGELVKVIVESINETEADFDIDSSIYSGEKNSWIESYTEKISAALPAGDLTVAVDYMHGSASPYFKDII